MNLRKQSESLLMCLCGKCVLYFERKRSDISSMNSI
jgi:hypothetical protein